MHYILLLILPFFTIHLDMQYNNFVKTEKKYWTIVNDGVMGGLSSSEIIKSDENTLIFTGLVSLENNGGFASVRYNDNYKVNKDSKLKIKLIGDSKDYQIRIKPNRFTRYSYSKTIQTTKDVQTIIIPLSEFSAQFRGFSIDKENFNYNSLQEIGFLIGNKKSEKFRLEIIEIEIIN